MSSKRNKALETSNEPSKPYVILRSVWRTSRWLMEFGLPIYVFTVVICFTFLSLATHNKKITLPLIGTISSEEIKILPVDDFPTESTAARKKTRADIQREADVMVLKEQIKSLEKAQDQNLTIIAGLAALLTFFGFKGIATLAEAKKQVSEVESRTEVAQARINTFFDRDYEINTRMSLNVAHGIVARDIAKVYRRIAATAGKDPCNDADTQSAIVAGLNYLNSVIDNQNEVGQQILIRARGVMGNLFYLKGDYRQALEQAKEILKLDKTDNYAWFNVACYSSLIAKDLAASGKSISEFAKYADNAIAALVQAGQSGDFKHDAQNEPDLAWLKQNRSAEFAVATK